MGPRKDLNYDNRVPGPGHYEYAEVLSRDASPAWK